MSTAHSLRPSVRLPGLSRLSGLAILAACAGCSQVGSVVDPFNVLGISKPPVRFGVTELDLLPPPLLVPKRALFEQDLSYHLKEPVSFDLMTPRQIRVHLGTARLKFALLTPGDYAEVAPANTGEILAVPINKHGETSRRGLIIVAKDSPLNSLADLRGRRFHFLPKDNVLNEAALGALMEAGLTRDELNKGLFGLGLDTSHISSLEVAKSVALEDRSAGVIDEADYNAWPESGGSLLLLLPSRDQVKVIAQTVRVPEGPVMVSIHTTPEMRERVSNYLLNVVSGRKAVLDLLGVKGFAPPIDPGEYAAFSALHLKLHPPEEPVDTGDPAESMPAVE